MAILNESTIVPMRSLLFLVLRVALRAKCFCVSFHRLYQPFVATKSFFPIFFFYQILGFLAQQWSCNSGIFFPDFCEPLSQSVFNFFFVNPFPFTISIIICQCCIFDFLSDFSTSYPVYFGIRLTYMQQLVAGSFICIFTWKYGFSPLRVHNCAHRQIVVPRKYNITTFKKIPKEIFIYFILRFLFILNRTDKPVIIFNLRICCHSLALIIFFEREGRKGQHKNVFYFPLNTQQGFDGFHENKMLFRRRRTFYDGYYHYWRVRI